MSNLNHSKKRLAQSYGVTGRKMEWGLRWKLNVVWNVVHDICCLIGSRHGCLPASPKAFVHDFPVFYPCPQLPVHSCFSCCMSGGVAVQLCRYPWRHCNLSSQLLPGGWVKAITNRGIKSAPTAAVADCFISLFKVGVIWQTDGLQIQKQLWLTSFSEIDKRMKLLRAKTQPDRQWMLLDCSFGPIRRFKFYVNIQKPSCILLDDLWWHTWCTAVADCTWRKLQMKAAPAKRLLPRCYSSSSRKD